MVYQFTKNVSPATVFLHRLWSFWIGRRRAVCCPTVYSVAEIAALREELLLGRRWFLWDLKVSGWILHDLTINGSQIVASCLDGFWVVGSVFSQWWHVILPSESSFREKCPESQFLIHPKESQKFSSIFWQDSWDVIVLGCKGIFWKMKIYLKSSKQDPYLKCGLHFWGALSSVRLLDGWVAVAAWFGNTVRATCKTLGRTSKVGCFEGKWLHEWMLRDQLLELTC